MPVIHFHRGIKIVVYFKDHWPPHVHVIGPDFEVSVRLDNLESTSTSASLKVQRMARELVRKNIKLCWKSWNETHEKS